MYYDRSQRQRVCVIARLIRVIIIIIPRQRQRPRPGPLLTHQQRHRTVILNLIHTSIQEKLLKDVKEADKQQNNKKAFYENKHCSDSARSDIIYIRSFGVEILAACSYSKLLNKLGIDVLH